MPQHLTTAKDVAASLLNIGAIKLSPDNPFTWSSGWKSPIYCDNRLSLSYPEIRTLICDALVVAISENFPGAEAIAGVATAGIPQGALVADRLGIPFLYVRSKAKGHGMENLIEGKISPGQKVVILEDLISTGGSSLKAAEALKSSGFTILGMAAIFTYGFDISVKDFEKADIQLVCLSDYSTMLKEAVERNYLDEKDLGPLEEWRKDPAGWKS